MEVGEFRMKRPYVAGPFAKRVALGGGGRHVFLNGHRHDRRTGGVEDRLGTEEWLAAFVTRRPPPTSLRE